MGKRKKRRKKGGSDLDKLIKYRYLKNCTTQAKQEGNSFSHTCYHEVNDELKRKGQKSILRSRGISSCNRVRLQNPRSGENKYREMILMCPLWAARSQHSIQNALGTCTLKVFGLR